MACGIELRNEILADIVKELKAKEPNITKTKLTKLSKEILADTLNYTENTSDLDSMLTHKVYKGERPSYLVPDAGLFDTANKYVQWAISNGIIKPTKAVITSDLAKSAVKGISDKSKSVVQSDWVQNYHKDKMTNSEGIYHKTFNALKDRETPSELVNELLIYMKLKTGIDYKQISKYLSVTTIAARARTEIDIEMLTKSLRTFRSVTKDYTKKQLDHISSAFNFSHIHLIPDSEMDDILYKDGLDKQITNLEKELVKGGSTEIGNTLMKNVGISKSAKDLANFYHTRNLDDIVDTVLNERFIYSTLSGPYLENYIKLVSLHQLKLGGKEQLKTLAKFKKDGVEDGVYTEMVMLSKSASTVGNQIDVDLRGKSMFKLDNKTGRSVHFKKNYSKVALLSQEDVDKLKPEDKWTIVKPFKEGQIGVAIRERTDFGQTSGIVSNTTIPDDGIHISHDDYLKYKFDLKANNVEVREYDKVPRYVLRLTQDMLDKMEVDNETPSMLHRSYAHNEEILQSMSTIQHIIDNQTTKVYTPREADKVEKDLSDGIKPMFLNFDRSAGSLLSIKDYPLIRKEYMPTMAKHRASEKDAKFGSATSVLEFPKYATMVHRDLKTQMLGYSNNPLFNNKNTYIHKAEQLIRDLVTMFGVHVAIVNPVKIAMDATSTASILAIHRVPMTKVAKYGKEAAVYHKEFSHLRQKQIMLKMMVKGIDESNPQYRTLKAQLDKVEKDINHHPFKVAEDNGFNQTLSTQMLIGDREANEGLQRRLDNFLSKVDDYPTVVKIMDSMSHTGLSMASIFTYANEQVTSDGTLKSELTRLSQKFNAIKDTKQHQKFVNEILASPGQSELVRYGGALTTMVDLVGKWTLYKHLLDQMSQNQSNLTAKERDDIATEIVHGSFIDYRDNLPEQIEQWKALGLFMFPHFFLRIQKMLWSLAYTKAATGGATYVGMNELTNYGNAHIANSLVGLRGTAEVGLNANLVAPKALYDQVHNIF
jgi:hypothetical protein